MLADVAAIAGFGPRTPGSPGLASAQAWVAARLTALGWSVADELFAWRGHAMRNQVVERPGADGSWILVLAHLDSVPGCPGANDNATGVALLLALAERWRTRPLPGPGIRFVVTVNEEIMHLDPEGGGSAVHAAGCAARGERIRAALALDTLGCFDRRWGTQMTPRWWLRPWFGWRGDYLAVAGPWASRALVRRAVTALRTTAPMPVRGFALPRGVRWSMAGDHAPFVHRGIPAVRICDTDRLRYPHYHRGDDRPGQITLPEGLPGALDDLLRTLLAVV